MMIKRPVRLSFVLSALVIAGWIGISLGGELVDINSATPDQLKALPGMTEGYIMMIVGARPFQSKEDLVEQKLLPQETYDQMKDRIFVKGGVARPSPPSVGASSPSESLSGAQATDRREGSEMGVPSGSTSARLCIREERTKQVMCGEAIR